MQQHDDQGHPWEQAQGVDSAARVRSIGENSLDWRARAGYERSELENDSQKAFCRRIHTWGAHVLQMVLVDEDKGSAKNIRVHEARSEGQAARVRLRKREVKVADTEDTTDTLAIKVDKEWNTSGWSDEMVQDGVKTLFEIFYDSKKAEMGSKEVACTMLVKLVDRHPAAAEYVRETIGQLVGLAANRFIRGGKSAGVLDLLHIINVTKEYFFTELSDCMVVSRIFQMSGLESTLAATIIQHFFRGYYAAKKREKRSKDPRLLPVSLTFGEDSEIQRIHEEAIKVRTKELKARWSSMHLWQRAPERALCIGYRSPVYLGIPFTHVCLNIVRMLVGDICVPNRLANANRADVVNSNGCVLLCQCLGCNSGPFAPAAVSIMAQIAKVPESLYHMIGSGCIAACAKHLHILVVQSRVSFVYMTMPDRSLDDLSKTEKDQHPIRIDKMSFFDCLNCIAHTAIHAAGFYRARHGYNYIKHCEVLGEQINYKQYFSSYALNTIEVKSIETALGSIKLLGIVFQLLRSTHNLHVVRVCLRILNALASGDTHRHVLKEACLDAGANTERVLQLLQEGDPTVHSLSLSFLLQLCTLDYARHSLLYANVQQMISKYIAPRKDVGIRSYQRALLVAAACLRQHSWRAFEPTAYPLFLSDPENVRRAIYLDMLKTITNTAHLVGSDKMNIPDLLVLPLHRKSGREFSIIAESIGGRELAYWLTNPNVEDYFSTLTWDEGVAGCMIIDALTMHGGTLQNLYSVNIGIYLGRCIHLSRFLFGKKKKMSERQALVIFSGVRSAATAFGRMCSYCHNDSSREELILSIRRSDLLSCSHFFVNTLSEKNPNVDKAIVNLRTHTGLSVVFFFTEYTRMISKMSSVGMQKQDELYREIVFAGKSSVDLIRSVPIVFGVPAMAHVVLSCLCNCVLVLVQSSRRLVDEAISEWNVFSALQENMPSSLSDIIAVNADIPLYENELGQLPDSYFLLVSALCQLDAGKILAINEGFLRRSVELVQLLMPYRSIGSTKAGGLPKHPDKIIGCDEISLSEPATNDGVKFAKQIAASLSVVASLGTFTSSLAGSANVLILNAKYDCVNNINTLLHDSLYGKDHAVTTSALCVLGSLSIDCHVVCGEGCVFQTLDILGTIRDYLHHAKHMVDAAVAACLQAINKLVPITTDYVTKRLKEIVLPLTRVNRVKPAFNQQVLDTIWAIALRLNSFSTGEENSRDRHKTRIVHALHEHAEWSDITVFTGDMKRALAEDTVLAKQLAAMYLKSGIDPTQPLAKKRDAMNIAKLFTSSLGEPRPGSIKIGNEKEWHNPTFEDAKNMSSPLEMRHRNFVTDIAAQAGVESPFLPRSSPHSLEAFKKSSYGMSLKTEFDKSLDGTDSVQYCMSTLSPKKLFSAHETDETEVFGSKHQSPKIFLKAASLSSASLPSMNNLRSPSSMSSPVLSLNSSEGFPSAVTSPLSNASQVSTSPLSTSWTDNFWSDNDSPNKQSSPLSKLSVSTQLSSEQRRNSNSKNGPSAAYSTSMSPSSSLKKKKKRGPSKVSTPLTEVDVQDAPELMMTRPKGAMIHII